MAVPHGTTAPRDNTTDVEAALLDVSPEDWDAVTVAAGGESPYAVLNVPPTAPPGEIRQRYRQMSLLAHPDRSSSAANKSALAGMFPVISQANQTLSTLSSRIAFDVQGEPTPIDPFIESLLSPYAIERTVLDRAIDRDIDIADHDAHLQLSCAAGNSPTSAEMQTQATVDCGTGIDHLLVSASCSVIDTGRHLAPTSVLTTTSVAWLHAISRQSSSRVTLSLPLGLDAELRHEFSSMTSAAVGMGLRTIRHRRRRTLPSLWLRLTRSFSRYVSAVMQIALEPVLALSISAKRASRTRSGVTISGGLRLSGVNSGLEGRAESRGTYVEVRGLLTQASLEVGTSYRIGRRVRVRYGVTLDAMDGVSLAVSLERGACRLRVPLSIWRDETGPSLSGRWLLFAVAPIIGRLLWTLSCSRVSDRYLSDSGCAYVEQRKAALHWQATNAASATRIRQREEDIDGLVIVQAVYGDLSTKESTAHDAADDGGDDDDDVDDSVADEWSRTFPSSMDATIPLQCLVADSRLVLAGPHSAHDGLFEIRHGPLCKLRVRYLYRCIVHECTVTDDQELALPNLSHIKE
ncbi:J domain-containing protein [Plasmodiophora brassicae]|uniref:J domain-containing protein n=1 Tax=Plasmodiophora brassicae TaxID=37360 RepID=A0A3P3YN78_PLABS|nr:unnamed protein product [Plasmodiophora brassicae]